METKEIFKDIPGYEGYYQASNMGNIRSVDRTVVDSRGQERFLKGRILEGSVHKTTGYRQVTLNINSEGRTFTASQIVAVTFLNHIPDGYTKVVDHINGNRLDDRVKNLRIITHRKNLSNVCFRKDRDSLSSKFTGVYWSKNNSKWRAKIRYEDKQIYLGLYDNELEASEAYQKALAKVKDNTFNPLDYKPVYTSMYKGVYFNKQKNRWQSQIWVNGKNKNLGLYPTELEAHQALQKFKQNLSQKNRKKEESLYL